MPRPVVHEGQRLPATYVNFLFVNGALLVPTFGDRARDRQALARLQRALPRPPRRRRRLPGAHLGPRRDPLPHPAAAGRLTPARRPLPAATVRPCPRSRRDGVAADQAFSRAAGAPLVDGNAVRLLRDGTENYPAWLEAIAAAERFIHFESYILHDDETGARFAEALVARATAGVRVRVIYDWLGGAGRHLAQLLVPLVRRRRRGAGLQPAAAVAAAGWLARDHRKMLAVDGRVAFVSGLCVGDAWTGTAERRAVARHRRRDPRARRWPTCTPSSPRSGRPPARRCRPTRCRPREAIAAAGDGRAARRRHPSGGRRHAAARQPRRRPRAQAPVDHRRLLRRASPATCKR